MNVSPTELYIKGNDGNIRVWGIGVEDWTIVMEYGVVNGSMIRKTENVLEGKAGRTRKEQIMSRISSRIHKRLDMGYTNDIRKATEEPVRNSLGLYKPMLAQRYNNVKNINYNRLCGQFKYNGHRCLVTNQGGQLTAYSRNGKPITSIDHILRDMDIPEGATIDGELYHHGTALQTISSWVRRNQEMSTALQYIVYDTVEDDSFVFRNMLLKEYGFNEHVIIAPTVGIPNPETVPTMFSDAKARGYEGLILRQDGFGYEDGKRSKSLVKVKSVLDEEYLVIDIVPSADNWAILICEDFDGKQFRVSAPGTIKDKEEVLNNRLEYIGSYVNVEFAEFTKALLPFHPVATAFRDKKAE